VLAELLPAVRCWLTVPLDTRAGRLGLLVLGSDQLAGYGAAHRRLAAALADQGMIAFENARLAAGRNQVGADATVALDAG
jgi:GAF domain-containing protein